MPHLPRGPLLLNLGCGERVHPDWVNVDFRASSPGVLDHDLRQPLPFETTSCAAVYHSHVLEHFAQRMAPVFLGECFRVLAPGGILRVVVPDLETLARVYLRCLEGALAREPGAAQRYEWITMELLDQLVREESGGEMAQYWSQNPMPAEDFVIQRCGSEVLRWREAFRQQTPAAAPRPPPSPEEIVRFRDSGEVHKWMYDRYSLSVLLHQAGFREFKVCAADESRIPNFNSFQLDLNPDGTVRKPDSMFVEAVKP